MSNVRPKVQPTLPSIDNHKLLLESFAILLKQVQDDINNNQKDRVIPFIQFIDKQLKSDKNNTLEDNNKLKIWSLLLNRAQYHIKNGEQTRAIEVIKLIIDSLQPKEDKNSEPLIKAFLNRANESLQQGNHQRAGLNLLQAMMIDTLILGNDPTLTEEDKLFLDLIDKYEQQLPEPIKNKKGSKKKRDQFDVNTTLTHAAEYACINQHEAAIFYSKTIWLALHCEESKCKLPLMELFSLELKTLYDMLSTSIKNGELQNSLIYRDCMIYRMSCLCREISNINEKYIDLPAELLAIRDPLEKKKPNFKILDTLPCSSKLRQNFEEDILNKLTSGSVIEVKHQLFLEDFMSVLHIAEVGTCCYKLLEECETEKIDVNKKIEKYEKVKNYYVFLKPYNEQEINKKIENIDTKIRQLKRGNEVSEQKQIKTSKQYIEEAKKQLDEGEYDTAYESYDCAVKAILNETDKMHLPDMIGLRGYACSLAHYLREIRKLLKTGKYQRKSITIEKPDSVKSDFELALTQKDAELKEPIQKYNDISDKILFLLNMANISDEWFEQMDQVIDDKKILADLGEKAELAVDAIYVANDAFNKFNLAESHEKGHKMISLLNNTIDALDGALKVIQYDHELLFLRGKAFLFKARLYDRLMKQQNNQQTVHASQSEEDTTKCQESYKQCLQSAGKDIDEALKLAPLLPKYSLYRGRIFQAENAYTSARAKYVLTLYVTNIKNVNHLSQDEQDMLFGNFLFCQEACMQMTLGEKKGESALIEIIKTKTENLDKSKFNATLYLERAEALKELNDYLSSYSDYSAAIWLLQKELEICLTKNKLSNSSDSSNKILNEEMNVLRQTIEEACNKRQVVNACIIEYSDMFKNGEIQKGNFDLSFNHHTMLTTKYIYFSVPLIDKAEMISVPKQLRDIVGNINNGTIIFLDSKQYKDAKDTFHSWLQKLKEGKFIRKDHILFLHHFLNALYVKEVIDYCDDALSKNTQQSIEKAIEGYHFLLNSTIVTSQTARKALQDKINYAGELDYQRILKEEKEKKQAQPVLATTMTQEQQPNLVEKAKQTVDATYVAEAAFKEYARLGKTSAMLVLFANAITAIDEALKVIDNDHELLFLKGKAYLYRAYIYKHLIEQEKDNQKNINELQVCYQQCLKRAMEVFNNTGELNHQRILNEEEEKQRSQPTAATVVRSEIDKKVDEAQQELEQELEQERRLQNLKTYHNKIKKKKRAINTLNKKIKLNEQKQKLEQQKKEERKKQEEKEKEKEKRRIQKAEEMKKENENQEKIKKEKMTNRHRVKEQKRKQKRQIEEEEVTQVLSDLLNQIEMIESEHGARETINTLVDQVEKQTAKNERVRKLQEAPFLFNPVNFINMPPWVLQFITSIQTLLEPGAERTYLGGGIVRDLVFCKKRDTGDYDFRTGLSPEMIKRDVPKILKKLFRLEVEPELFEVKKGIFQIKLRDPESKDYKEINISVSHSPYLANENLSLTEAFRQDALHLDFIQNVWVALPNVSHVGKNTSVFNPLGWPYIAVMSDREAKLNNMDDLMRGHIQTLNLSNEAAQATYNCIVLNRGEDIVTLNHLGRPQLTVTHLDPSLLPIESEFRSGFQKIPKVEVEQEIDQLQDGIQVVTSDNMKLLSKVIALLDSNYHHSDVINNSSSLNVAMREVIPRTETIGCSYVVPIVKDSFLEDPIRGLRAIRLTPILSRQFQLSDSLRRAINDDNSTAAFQQLIYDVPGYVNSHWEKVLCGSDQDKVEAIFNLLFSLPKIRLIDISFPLLREAFNKNEKLRAWVLNELKSKFSFHRVSYVYALFITCIDVYKNGDNNVDFNRVENIILTEGNELYAAAFKNGASSRFRNYIERAYANWTTYRDHSQQRDQKNSNSVACSVVSLGIFSHSNSSLIYKQYQKEYNRCVMLQEGRIKDQQNLIASLQPAELKQDQILSKLFELQTQYSACQKQLHNLFQSLLTIPNSSNDQADDGAHSKLWTTLIDLDRRLEELDLTKVPKFYSTIEPNTGWPKPCSDRIKFVHQLQYEIFDKLKTLYDNIMSRLKEMNQKAVEQIDQSDLNASPPMRSQTKQQVHGQ